MGRTLGSKDLTAEERRQIRRLFREDVRLVDIAKGMHRSLTAIERVVRGMKRKRLPRPKRPNEKRNDRVLRLVEQGLSRTEVGRKVGLSATQVSYIVVHHPKVVELLRSGKVRPGAAAKRWRLEASTVARIVSGKTKTGKRTRAGGRY